jgi:hypothetical protein
LDDLINEKSRAGWELYGVYAESPDGSKYRVLFKVPCPEREMLAAFARDNGQTFPDGIKRAAEQLLQDLLGLNGTSGFVVQPAEAGRVYVALGHVGSAVSAEVVAKDGAIWIVRGKGGTEIPLWFNSAHGGLEPKDSAKKDGLVSQTALGVLVELVLKEMK